MKIQTHTFFCAAPGCSAYVKLELSGASDLRSTGQMLHDIAEIAGWDLSVEGFAKVDNSVCLHVDLCAEHRWSREPRCICVARTGIKHADDCPRRSK